MTRPATKRLAKRIRETSIRRGVEMAISAAEYAKEMTRTFRVLEIVSHSKPRMRSDTKTRTGIQTKWKCSGSGCYGYGDTPEEAYFNWFERLRGVVM